MVRVVRDRGRRRGLLVCATAALSFLCASAPGASALPDNRGYELVSPAAKHGTGVVSDSRRTRAAASGDAVQFLSLGAFADAIGTGVATDYVAERTGTPGTSGWATHAITPLQSSTTYDGILGGTEPLYVGEFSPDLSAGVFFAQSPLTNDPGTANVPNLYRRNDLLTPGSGTYELVSQCPLCDAPGATPLPPPTDSTAAEAARPLLAWMSPDGSHIAFESQLKLTADTPAFLGRVELYQWTAGTLALTGRVPRSGGSFCDDVSGPVCISSPLSIAGQGATNLTRAPHVVSDGTDGHSRVFFTFPTGNGVTPNPGNGQAGQLYMRVDGTQTVKLNASERSTPDAFAPATFLDASADGDRVFFMTPQALTDDTPADGVSHIYMYDASTPASAPGHLTFLNADKEPVDNPYSGGVGIVGLSSDGRYVYFVSTGQIVAGQPLLGTVHGLYLWHDGVVRFITSLQGVDEGDLLSSGIVWTFRIRQARVTPDGRWLLYRAISSGTRQFFLYGADSGGLPVCISCPLAGQSAVDSADAVTTDVGGTTTSWHENHALSDDGSRVFFSTAQALVPEDVNGRADVYEYDVASGSVHLISSGTSPEDSWFMDASPSGRDVFFTTSQQLVGWDTDQEYDVYDARVNGGFPDPLPNAPACAADACHGALATPPLTEPGASAVFSGASNAVGKLKTRARPCRRGYVRKRVRGRVRCVKKRTSRRAKGRRARSGQRRTA